MSGGPRGAATEPLPDEDEGPVDPLDVRLAVPAVTAWGVAWAALALPAAIAFGGAVLAVAVAVLTFRLVHGRARLLAVVTLLCAGAAAGVAGMQVAALAGSGVPAVAAGRPTVIAELVLTSDLQPVAQPRWEGGSALLIARARLESVQARGRRLDVRAPVVVLAGDDWAHLLPGQRLRTSGRLQPPRHGGDAAAALVARGEPTPLAGPGTVQSWAGDLRAGLRQAARGLPAEERGLLPGLVVGDTSAMPPDLEEDFRTAGLTHLTAVSGANVAIVVGTVLYAGRWVGVPARAAPAVGAAALVGFVVLARPEPSVLRAGCMGLVALLALASGRPRAGVPALAAAVLVLVLLAPTLARSYGFALSVLATTALLLLAPRWSAALAARGMPRPLADALAVPAAAQAVCAPVVVLLSAEVSLVAVPANLLVAPAVAPATIFGVLAAVVAPLAPGAASVLAWLGAVPVSWIVTVARAAADAPHAAVPWPEGVSGAVLLAGVTVLVVVAVRATWRSMAQLRRRRRLRPAGSEALGRRGLRQGEQRRSLRSRRARTAAALSVAVVSSVAVLMAVLVAVGLPVVSRMASPGSGWAPAGWSFVACDVGQGDALVLSTGPGRAVVVDAGPDPDAIDRCLRDLGVVTVDAVLLSHLHADHTDGLPGVLRGRRIGELVVGPLEEPAEQARQVRRWAATAGLVPRRAVAGETRAVGGLRWRVAWPHRVIDGEGSAANNASLVLEVVTAEGLRLLLTGDIEPPAQRALRAHLTGPVDVVKVPHHGSRHQDAALLSATGARLAVVSAGRDNDYGHPSRSTLDILGSAGALVLRTDRDGDVAVSGSPSSLRFVRRGR